jgi:hypothetical protein
MNKVILSLVLTVMVAYNANAIVSCERPTHLTQYRNYADDTVQNLVPNGNCDLIVDAPISSMACKNTAESKSYSCYQISKAAYLGYHGTGSTNYDACYACID